MPGPTIPTSEEVAYMLAHADDSLVADLIACTTVCATAATVFVGLRLWSRRVLRGRLTLDASDWLIVAAWVWLPLRSCLDI